MKPTLEHGSYLTKEQHLQGPVDWLVKDSEAWDWVGGGHLWSSEPSQSGTSRIGSARHRCTTTAQMVTSARHRGWYDTHTLISQVLHINFFIMLDYVL
jgi:hypothetical protein